ncbi:Plant self-incompatibility S1 [Macleaya cordata]|uniref:S-protein homolog n=1 Tax=Macleaya cordata TaxID=56857 RepID=A0A200QS10_MACCD|nr:Plant self-incompatibility S1 [Macleaya cordata]
MFTSVDGGLERVTVNVTNQIEPSIPMGIHCKSKDTDLGEHPAIDYGGSIHWKFKVNLWGTTLYWCNIWYVDASGRQIQGSFNIFEADRDVSWCHGFCLRFVKKGGIYFDLPGTNTSQLMYEWPH